MDFEPALVKFIGARDPDATRWIILILETCIY